MATNGSGVDEPMTEKINIDIVTLTRFLTEEQTKHKEATGDFTYRFPSLHISNEPLH
jgi:fructose-1,6-bisphosphatase I